MAMAAYHPAKKTSFELDTYVAETLMRDLVGHDRRPSAFLVYLAIAAAGADGARGLSHGDLAEMTGLSRRSVQDAIGHLARRKLIEVHRPGPTEMALYRALRPWKR
jgi:CRP-like cAMP-binding protein